MILLVRAILLLSCTDHETLGLKVPHTNEELGKTGFWYHHSLYLETFVPLIVFKTSADYFNNIFYSFNWISALAGGNL